MKCLFPVSEEEEACRCNTLKLEWRLTTTMESQFWGTKDVFSPRVQLYVVLKAAVISIQLRILSVYSNWAWKSQARHWKSDHLEDVKQKGIWLYSREKETSIFPQWPQSWSWPGRCPVGKSYVVNSWGLYPVSRWGLGRRGVKVS